MLSEKLHLMIRLPLILVCSSIVLLAILASIAIGRRADSPGRVSIGTEKTDRTDRTERAEESGDKAEDDALPSHSRSSFNEIMQVGGKMSGKNAQTDSHHPIELDAKGTSETSARKAATAALPIDQLSAENRQKVQTLLKSVSFYRRLPKVTFTVEPEVYNYFLAHPDVAVSIWRAMKISKLKMWQTGRFDYEADTGDGSVGALEILHIGGEKNLVVCDGMYKSQLFSKPIEARSLVLLQASFAKQPDGTVLVTHRADLFVSFPSTAIDVVARIFSPLTVKMTDRTFTEISLFLKMMSMAMSRRPDWVEHITEKMEGVADVRKEQVLELSTQVFTSAQNRELEQMGLTEKVPGGSRERAWTSRSTWSITRRPLRNGAAPTARVREQRRRRRLASRAARASRRPNSAMTSRFLLPNGDRVDLRQFWYDAVELSRRCQPWQRPRQDPLSNARLHFARRPPFQVTTRQVGPTLARRRPAL